MPPTILTVLRRKWQPVTVTSYGPLPNRQDDLDPVLSTATPTARAGVEFYDRSLTTRRYAFVGLAFSSIISCCCVATGAVIIATHGVSGVIPLMKLGGAMQHSTLPSELLTLILNLLVTICTEATGFIHSISLRFALVSESRLRFNTNLRLLTAARGWRNPNGALLNGIMAVLLIISYTLTSLVVFDNSTSNGSYASVAIAGFPILLLGVALLLQAVIAVLGLRAVEILTWSSSPFDLTAAMIHHRQFAPVPHQCMQGVSESGYRESGPTEPSKSQLSAWHAHFSIRTVVIALWVIVYACVMWVAILGSVYGMSHHFQWSLFPNNNPILQYLAYPTVNIQWWIIAIVNLAVFQAPMTLGLHCSELIANVIQNESQWRCATGEKGLHTATNALKAPFASPLGIVLLILKPALHWMFGLGFNAHGSGDGTALHQVELKMNFIQILNLCIVLIIFTGFVNFVTRRRPRGPQPATYGHIQTLANLVDAWSPVMWWGHKEDGLYCHAGRVIMWWSRGRCIKCFKQGRAIIHCQM
ncbi:hypothetical protein DEU56DRAFT_747210 [Suillus clintonianus]|uniref:uncharacterized protein n=1 Tax=Suillus clintonianus TaxID=1904413 RepID=UPI001B880C22|nr:uncharacterized protein DEU56DRAFT_747210 [Suillus clintonianus]KAG2119433.1 hypothetical protein DEU56DRAFT_747210 [Suillus clintonianus]